ncbi:MAG: hypothetical protein ACJAQT_004663, partial [Akkermansiaceae bacterium]
PEQVAALRTRLEVMGWFDWVGQDAKALV